MTKKQFPNYIIEYNDKIQSGEIVAGKWIKMQFAKLVDDIKNPKDPYVFDIERAMKPIIFMETFCMITTGRARPLKLELFQKARLQAVFGFVHKDTRLRQYGEVMTVMGRKNGKTTESAALVLYMMLVDGEHSADCYLTATIYEQAKIAFTGLHKMIQSNDVLKNRLRKVRESYHDDSTFSSIQTLSGDASGLDGKDAHFILVDEMAAMKDRDIYDIMKQATSARDQSLLYTITTNGFVRESIFDTRYQYAIQVITGEVEDRAFLPFLYQLDSRDEWDDPDMWMKANPGIGPIKKYSKLQGYVNEAKVDPAQKPTVMVKDFNMVETGSTAWLTHDIVENGATFDIADPGFKYGYGGIDMSVTTDLTAASVLMRRPGDDNIYVESMFWLPSLTIEERAREDGVPYDIYERKGLLRGSGEYKIEMSDVLDWFLEIRERYGIYIQKIGYDHAYTNPSDVQRFEENFGRGNMIKVRQGHYTLSAPMQELSADLGANKINYNNNQLLKLHLMNTEVKVDINGNIQPAKNKTKSKRIDGTIALLNAFVMYRDNKNEFLSLIG